MLMTAYQMQRPELVKAFGSVVSNEDGEVELPEMEITPVECMGVGYCLQHTSTNIKKVK